MAGTFEVDGTDVTVAFSYTAPIDLVQSVIDSAAEYLWVEEIVEDVAVNPFEDASNQEKLDIVDAHVKRVVLDLANTFKSLQAQRIARETEESNKYDL